MTFGNLNGLHQTQTGDVEFIQLQIRKHLPIIMYFLGYGLDDLGFKSRQGRETLFQTEREALQISNATKKTPLPISKTQSTSPNQHNTYGRMEKTVQGNTPQLNTDFPTHRSPAQSTSE